MKIVRLRLTSDLIIEEDTQYNDVTSKNVTVQKNVVTRIYGIISEKLIVKEGATVYLHGPLPGQIINEGGKVYVRTPGGDGITAY